MWLPCDRLFFVVIMLRTLLFGETGNNKTLSSSNIVVKLQRQYDSATPPPGGPTIVKLGIYINSFYAISDQSMDYSLNIYLRQQWRDPRLDYSKISSQPKIKLEDYMWKQIWTPDVFFRNEKRASFHEVTTPNRLMSLKQDGTVWYVAKITATLSCPMKLHKYPLDTQHCPMMFESFGYTMENIIYRWLGSPVEYDPTLELPQFRLTNHTLSDCSQNYTTGAYPCLKVDFTLKRDIGYYLIQLYIPSILIVILSWVAFWISVDAIPARVTIGLLTVLTMTTQSTGARSSLPRVSYVKAIDVWMSVCLLFVFASLLEFAVVNVFSRKEIRHTTRSAFRKRAPPKEEEIALEQINIVTHNGRDFRELREKRYMRDPEGRHKARSIDKLSRKLFPLAFLTFNIVYWLAYVLA